MFEFIPHRHVCEVKLFNPETWKENCPRMGNLSETEDECESCPHFVIVEFKAENPISISKVVHVNAS